MTRMQYRCQQEHRRAAVQSRLFPDGTPRLNGIDYLEVADDQQTLFVHFIHPLVNQSHQSTVVSQSTPTLGTDNIQLIGGERLSQISVVSVTVFDRQLSLRVNQPGDYSTYTLRLVRSPADEENPPVGIDPQLAQVDFSFWAGEDSEYDCRELTAPTEPPPPPPVIDYLAKDYASFRQLMLDRLTVTLPNWRERNPADLGMLLVELLAYRGDQLSYFQDAVATEAYLGTARKRVSVRRHARLLDYAMHDGCNARAWVAFQMLSADDGVVLYGPNDNRPGTLLLTKVPDLPPVLRSKDELLTALSTGAQVFETMETIPLHGVLNQLKFYTWGNQHCVLPRGATQATLLDTGGHLQRHLKVGRVLIFEERLSPRTGLAADANPLHRHAVRLTAVTATEDLLFREGEADSPPNSDTNNPGNSETQRQRLVTIHWSTADALPFVLTISTRLQGKPLTDVSLAWGNVVLADHGRTIFAEPLAPLPTIPEHPYRPRLQFGPLTQQGRVLNAIERIWQCFDPDAPAQSAMAWPLRDVHPSITLQATEPPSTQSDTPENPLQLMLQWQPQRDLLNSSPFALEFMTETEEAGQVYLRFGDDVLGKRPTVPLQARYRIGNGQAGNVGARAIAHAYLPTSTVEQSTGDTRGLSDGVSDQGLTLGNPLPAVGGVNPEPIETVKLSAPVAFREPKRAVTTEDYARFAQNFPGVQQALATRRWTGSWYTLFITVDRVGGKPVDPAFEAELLDALEPVRLAGHDLKIESPRFVPLDIALRVQVEPEYFVRDIEAVLQEVFSNRVRRNGALGFFHPDRFTFGQPVYLSQIVAAAVAITGVRSVVTTRFQRWGKAARHELESGQIVLARLEIARLNNDPNAPEQGRMIFEMEGGL